MQFTSQDHTFVVCAYKENPFLEDLVVSLESQVALGNILIATSTPNDHIESICERHGVPLHVNRGKSSIADDWNFGYDSAQTPLVTIAHQDDRYEPEYLESVLGAFNAHPGLGIAHTDYYEIRDGERTDDNRLLAIKRRLNGRARRAMLEGTPDQKRKSFRFGNFVCCPSVTFDKTVCGPSVFDTRYVNSCDYLTWVQLASRGISFCYLPAPLMGHRIYAESTTTLNIESNVRATEDREILGSLWPAPIARIVSKAYNRSQKSNEIDES